MLRAAQFGVPLYGGALVGQVVYMKGNAKGCEVFEKRLPATELPTILLVERGGAQRRCPQHAFWLHRRLCCSLWRTPLLT